MAEEIKENSKELSGEKLENVSGGGGLYFPDWFCLGCGAEVRWELDNCPICGWGKDDPAL